MSTKFNFSKLENPEKWVVRFMSYGDGKLKYGISNPKGTVLFSFLVDTEEIDQIGSTGTVNDFIEYIEKSDERDEIKIEEYEIEPGEVVSIHIQ